MAARDGGLIARPATPEDAGAVVETVSLAFHDDPTWRWAFPDPDRRQEQYRVFWRLMVEGALRYPWVLTTDGYETVAVWIPPGGTEIAEENEAEVGPMLEGLLGERASDVIELLARFDAAHPREQQHYYLSLLGTHPDHLGRGLGMALLGESLTRIDRERMPAYLESSNPVNNRRYERHGFAPIVEFYPPGAHTPVTGMWRDAR